MGVREDIEKRIEKENQKVNELKSQVALSESFIQGLQEALKILPQNISEKTNTSKRTSGIRQWHFRSGSDTQKAYELLKQNRQHMNIHELLLGIGKADNEQNISSFASSMYRAVKKSGLIKKSGANFYVPSEENGVIVEEEKPTEKTMFELPKDFGKE